jgi:hypothetical protein
MRKTSAFARQRARRQAKEHPLMKQAREQHSSAVRKAADEEFQSQITTVKIKMLMMTDGEDATELLSLLAVVIGAPAQAGAASGLFDAAWVRQLRGALRSIQAMCLQGYKWQSTYALPLTRACEIAEQEQPEVTPEIFVQAWLDASLMSQMIEAHTIDEWAVLS